MKAKRIVACGAFGLILAGAAKAQTPTPSPSAAQQECTIPSVRPVDVRARIQSKPEPKFSRIDRDRYHGYVMKLRAVLCGSGKVTDVVVTQGITRDVDAAAIDAAHLIEFTPAEKDGKRVSTRVILEYTVKD
jgi:hypothetical protein